MSKLKKFTLAIAALALVSLGAPRAHAQGSNFTGMLISPSGRPLAGENVAVCVPVATSAAAVSSNLASLTMVSNPQTAGYVSGMSLLVAGFAGSDTYLNGTYVILSVTPTTIVYALVHANSTAATNGTALQTGNQTTPCAGLASIYANNTLSLPSANPFTTDGLGNYSWWAAPGSPWVQIYGSPITTYMRQVALPCVPGACSISNNGTFVVDGLIYPCNSAGINTLNAIVVAAGGGTLDARGCTGTINPMGAEIDIGGTTAVAVAFLPPPTGVWEWALTDGHSCGIRVFDRSSALGTGTPGVSSFTLQDSSSATDMGSLLCTPPGYVPTTAAALASNVVTLTLATNPTLDAWFPGEPIVVNGFSGADTYFNGTFTVASVNSTQITYNLTHANGIASSNGFIGSSPEGAAYVDIEGIRAYNPDGATFANGLTEFKGLFDNSVIRNVTAESYGGVSAYVHGTCCGTSFYNLTVGGGSTLLSQPLVVGKTGVNTTATSFYSTSAGHPGTGLNDVLVEGSSTWTIGIQFRNLYMEGPLCGTSGTAVCTDTTTPAAEVTAGLGATASGGGVLFDGVDLGSDVVSSTRYAVDIANGNGPVSVRFATSSTGNAINDHNGSGFTIAPGAYKLVGSYDSANGPYWNYPTWAYTPSTGLVAGGSAFSGTNFFKFTNASATNVFSWLANGNTRTDNNLDSQLTWILDSGKSATQETQFQWADQGTTEWIDRKSASNCRILQDNANNTNRFVFCQAANTAGNGTLRGANNELGPCWRNAANSADICTKFDASNIWNLGANAAATGFGNGTPSTAVTTTTKSTGTGPTTPQTIVAYMPVVYNGTTYWIPLVQ